MRQLFSQPIAGSLTKLHRRGWEGIRGAARSAGVSARQGLDTRQGRRVIGLVGISTDIIEHNWAEERRILLSHELNHRVKNTRATTQGLDQQVLCTAFEARTMALSAAHGLLTREVWEGASLNDVADVTLRAQGSPGRTLVGGPPSRLGPKTALALEMALRELCTIAAKYGALSGLGGQISLDWTGIRQAGGLFSLTWKERAESREVAT